MCCHRSVQGKASGIACSSNTVYCRQHRRSKELLFDLLVANVRHRIACLVLSLGHWTCHLNQVYTEMDRE